MIEDFQEQQRKRTMRIRSFMDFTMGGLFIAIGIVLLVYQVGTLGEINRKGLGVLFILYGIWRIYRGYKKNYFNER
jgi:threonine/homoserine/homoserine lactone efflux protein